MTRRGFVIDHKRRNDLFIARLRARFQSQASRRSAGDAMELLTVPPLSRSRQRIREAMFLRMPVSCFPYATAVGRLELDHTIAYTPLARGGQAA